ncbi:MAG: acyl-CoA thioesterase II [Arenicella sp.]|nr:acyl-CoA thioesterase II [Arenicella sp.]
MANQPKRLSGLLDFMSVEQLDRDLYRGQSRDLKTGQVYGGQVLGQAIKAALQTVDPERHIRSAHAYFLLKGDVGAPIIYEVDRSLDGGSVSSRRVVAVQHGKQILHLSASFHKEEKGLDYKPEADIPVDVLEAALSQDLPSVLHFQAQYLDVYYLSDGETTHPGAMQLWIKTKEKMPDDREAHNSVLAYISDMGLLHSTLVPHGLHNKGTPGNRGVIMASIDHAIWFHRPFRADEWFFYDCHVISTGGGRGLAQGRLYTRDGTLFASTCQEGLLRIPRQK